MFEPQTIVSLSLIAITAPFIFAIVAALKPTARAESVHDYFLFSRKLSSEDFFTTSIGYSLQVAAIFLFLYWTFLYGLASIFVPIAWGSGYLFLFLCIKNGWLDTFLIKASKSSQTIHGYVGAQLGQGGGILVKALAISTVVGLGGTLVTEVDYATRILLGSLDIKSQGFPFLKYIIHILVLGFACAYVFWGGYKAVVLTDRFQVPIAKTALFILLFAFIYQSSLVNQNIGPIILLSAVLAIILVFYFQQRRMMRYEVESGSMIGQNILHVVLATLGLYAMSVLVFGGNFSLPSFAQWVPGNGHFWGFGVLGVVSLVVANAIWQFVDISSLQRLQSVDVLTEDGSIDDQKRLRILDGIKATATESSLLWLLIIALAVSIKSLGIGTEADLYNYFSTLSGSSALLLPLFLFVVTIFMLSTVDGYLSGVAYVSYYDLSDSQATQGETESNVSQLLSRPRMVSLATITLVYLGYLVLQFIGSGRIDQVLYAIYAVQTAIAPSVLIALFKPTHLKLWPAVLSVLLGWVAAFCVALFNPPSWIVADSWYVLPPLASLTTASITYISTYLIYAYCKQRQPAE